MRIGPVLGASKRAGRIAIWTVWDVAIARYSPSGDRTSCLIWPATEVFRTCDTCVSVLLPQFFVRPTLESFCTSSSFAWASPCSAASFKATKSVHRISLPETKNNSVPLCAIVRVGPVWSIFFPLPALSAFDALAVSVGWKIWWPAAGLASHAGV